MNERGSTILEVLVALFILSTLGIGAWHAAGVSMRLAAHLRGSLVDGTRLLQLDDQLRAGAARVIPPFWAPDQLILVTDDSLTVPYLDGNVGKSLSLTYDNGILRVRDGEHSIQYDGFKKVIFAAATDGREQYGITLRLDADGTPVTITARFGGTPVGKDSSR